MKDYEATGAPRAHNVAFPIYMLHVMHKKFSNYNELMHYASFVGADLSELSAYCCMKYFTQSLSSISFRSTSKVTNFEKLYEHRGRLESET